MVKSLFFCWSFICMNHSVSPEIDSFTLWVYIRCLKTSSYIALSSRSTGTLAVTVVYLAPSQDCLHVIVMSVSAHTYILHLTHALTLLALAALTFSLRVCRHASSWGWQIYRHPSGFTPGSSDTQISAAWLGLAGIQLRQSINAPVHYCKGELITHSHDRHRGPCMCMCTL